MSTTDASGERPMREGWYDDTDGSFRRRGRFLLRASYVRAGRFEPFVFIGRFRTVAQGPISSEPEAQEAAENLAESLARELCPEVFEQRDALQARVAELERMSVMGCENPPEDCACPGCQASAEFWANDKRTPAGGA